MSRLVPLLALGCSYEAFVASRAGTGPSPESETTELSVDGENVFGVAFADLDRDGVSDIAIVDIAADTIEPTAFARLRVHYGGSREALDEVADASLEGPRFDTRPQMDGVTRGADPSAGLCVGDFDGDGIDDLVVGAGFRGGGSLFIVYGNQNRRLSDEELEPVWSVDGRRFGDEVRCLGDVDSDGADEIVVLAEGRAMIISAAEREVSVGEESVRDELFAVGDLNHDGSIDLAEVRGDAVELYLSPLSLDDLTQSTRVPYRDELGRQMLDSQASAQGPLRLLLSGSRPEVLELSIDDTGQLQTSSILVEGSCEQFLVYQDELYLGCPQTECEQERCGGRITRWLLGPQMRPSLRLHSWIGDSDRNASSPRPGERIGSMLIHGADVDGDGRSDLVFSGPHGPVHLAYGS